jgi:hypothetical protein
VRLTAGAENLIHSQRLATLEVPPAGARDWLDWLGRLESGALALCSSNIYFVQSNGVAGPIKIGMARDVGKRMAQFRIANPFPLVCLAQHQAPFDAERRLHQAFSSHALGGEWFNPSAEILAFANDVGLDGPRFIRGVCR